MIKRYFIFFFLIRSIPLFAQTSYYDFLPLGKHRVAFFDTIIYDQHKIYNQYGYSGSSPLFVQVWFPNKKVITKQYLRFSDLRNTKTPKELDSVYKILNKHCDESILRDCILYDIRNDNELKYGNFSPEEVLTKIQNVETRALRSESSSITKYPVIVYHHGSRGLSDENYLMAEYFASQGYIFISANFHLPYRNSPFGLLPYELEKNYIHDQSAAKTVIDFAYQLSGKSDVFFIGHSWGAQEGWCFLNEAGTVKAFISMETTIEFKSDSTEIKDKWPHVYEALKINKKKIAIPVLLFAATERAGKFDFFASSGTNLMVHTSCKTAFAHNSYTALYMQRYFFKNEIPQADSTALYDQINGYVRHVKLIHHFLESVRQHKKFKHKPFSGYFYFS
ncbi:MAG TPA: hypothetical protein PK798_10790 [Flavobacteriales bacterium]|nr:hypothetical protein [Flavobacteriales bacterium]HRJ39267.1 hypothetical protein [Flavobacteriales bacterium]